MIWETLKCGMILEKVYVKLNENEPEISVK